MQFTPPNLTIEESQAQLIKRFTFFDNWKDRYAYLMDFSKKLPPFDSAWQTEENRIKGCQSQVWMQVFVHEGRLYFFASADAKLVGGIIALLHQVFNGRTPQEILAAKLDFLKEIGLLEHLSPARANGLHAMIKTLHAQAQAAI